MFASFHPALRDLVRFDRSKIRGLTAFQNATGVFVPLAVGAATGHLLLGLAASIGALNACFSDRPGPYGLRAGRMVVVSFLGALSALVGGTTGSIQWLAVALVALWGLGGGMLVVSGPAAEQIGVTSIILLVVYAGFGLSPSGALLQAAFILVGGLFQAVLSVVAWPFRPFGPERNALAAVFRQLAAFARAPSEPTEAPPVTAEITTARTTLTGLGAVHTTAAEALRVLLDEAERIRLEFIALHQLRSVLPDDDRQPLHSANFEGVWTAASELLDRLAVAVTCGETVLEGAQILQRAQRYVTAMRQVIEGGVRDDAVVGEALSHVDALLGQLRACVEIVSLFCARVCRLESAPRVRGDRGLRQGGGNGAEQGRGPPDDSLAHEWSECLALHPSGQPHAAFRLVPARTPACRHACHRGGSRALSRSGTLVLGAADGGHRPQA